MTATFFVAPAGAASPVNSPEAAELEQMLHEHAAKRVQAARPALVPPTAPLHTPVSARPAGRPPWVDGADSAYPAASYLCAVGAASHREMAANAAYGNLAKTFVVRVQAVSQDALAVHQSTGQRDHSTQDLQVSNQLTSTTSLAGVSIYETWEAPDGQVYAWACLDRARAAAALSERITDVDAKSAFWLKQAEGADTPTRLRALAHALDAVSARSAALAQLRWVDTANSAPAPPKVGAAELAARLAQALRGLRIGVWSEGLEHTAARGALVQAITARGYRASAVSEAATLSTYDMVVVAKTDMEHAGSTMVGPTTMQLARGFLQVEIRQGDAVLAAYEATQKAGSQSVADARRRVVRGLSSQIAQDFGPKIDAAVRGTLPQVDL